MGSYCKSVRPKSKYIFFHLPISYEGVLWIRKAEEWMHYIQFTEVWLSVTPSFPHVKQFRIEFFNVKKCIP